MRRHVAACAAVAAALGVCAPAGAQYGGPQQIQPTRSALWAELGFYTGHVSGLGGLAGVDSTVVSPLLEGYFGVTDFGERVARAEARRLEELLAGARELLTE